MGALISVITSVRNKENLNQLIESVKLQKIATRHILLFPKNINNQEEFKILETEIDNYSSNCMFIKEDEENISNKESYLKSIGLITANTDYVTFADDNIIWEENHLITMLDLIQNNKWVVCKKRIWTTTESGEYEYLGEYDLSPYFDNNKILVDNNCIMFRRKYGSSSACIFRENKLNNDNTQMFDFLSKHAGFPGLTKNATINWVCNNKVADYFRNACKTEINN